MLGTIPGIVSSSSCCSSNSGRGRLRSSPWCRMQRVAEQLPHRSHLNLAAVHDDDAITGLSHHCQVMGNSCDRRTLLL